MEELQAQEIITAHAACAIVDGCKLCPLYDPARESRRQQCICQDAITQEKVREALIALRGRIENK